MDPDDQPAIPTGDYLARRAPVHATASPDGTRLAVTVTSVPPGAEVCLVELLVLDTGSGELAAARGSLPGDRWGSWSPDGTRLAFVGRREDRDGVVVAGPDGEVFWPVGEAASPPAWAPDGSAVALAVHRGQLVDRTRPYRWTRPIAAFDGTGPLEDPPQLLLVDAATGSGRWLTDDGWRWGAPVWSPDGSRLAAPAWLDPDGRVPGTQLRLVGTDGTVQVPDVPTGRSITLAWESADRLLALVAEPGDRPVGSSPRLWRVSPAGTGCVQVSVDGELLGDVYGDQPAELADDPSPVLLSDGPGGFVVRSAARGRMGIARLRLSGDTAATTAWLGGDRCLSPFACAAGQVFFTAQSAEHPVDVWAVALAGGEPRRLTFFHDGSAEPAPAGVRRDTVQHEGRELDLWFLGGGATPSPTVVLVHGGPQFAFGEAFNLDAQALCAAGFGVLYTNVRGSTGYGEEAGGAVVGDWAEGPARDLLAAVDRAVELGWADPDRLGVAGNSFGGYLSAWVAATTDRFRAAVCENPVTDLVSMASTSDIAVPFFARQLGGELHEIPETYLAQSPVLHAHRCRTPLLFVIGAEDRRCPNHQAWGMHRLVHRAGTPSEVLVLPGATHEGSTYGPPAGRLAHDAALVEWMSRWLLAP